MESDRPLIAKHHQVKGIKKQESLINQRIKFIQQSRDLSGEEKTRRIDLLNEQMARRLQPA
jgi:hypothetical protein